MNETSAKQERVTLYVCDCGWSLNPGPYRGPNDCEQVCEDCEQPIRPEPFIPLATHQQALDVLKFAEGAITYAREPHHLNHAEECALCNVATDHLDMALEQLRTALNQDNPDADSGGEDA